LTWTLVLGLWSLVLPDSSLPDIFSWTDEDGIVSFSNIRCPDTGHGVVIRQEYDPALPPGLGTPPARFRVTRVLDGDSIRVTAEGLSLMVRLAGIDAPETGAEGITGQPFALDATRALEGLVLEKEVTLAWYGADAYNRVLAELYAGGILVNLELVRLGLAEAWQGKPPRGFDPGPYLQAEAGARSRGLGIWSQGRGYVSPRQWRQAHPRKE
jgi:endonuclease YncB( thermonuclease family)